jgi:hypothetical protein
MTLLTLQNNPSVLDIAQTTNTTYQVRSRISNCWETLSKNKQTSNIPQVDLSFPQEDSI